MALLDEDTEHTFESLIAALGTDREKSSTSGQDLLVSAAQWLFEFVSELDDRPVSAAEANMEQVLGSCADCFAEAGAAADDLTPVLRLAIFDLNHGWDLDVDNTGNSMLEVSLELLALLAADSAAADDRFIALLRLTADKVREARLRDLAAHIGATGAVVVRRPGVGPVRLQAGLRPANAVGPEPAA